MCSSQSDCESRARERATREADGRRFPASPRDPRGARALHLPVSTGKASLVRMSPRRCPWPRDRASAHSPEGVHRKQCSGAHECVQSTRPEAPQCTVSIRKLRGVLHGIPVAPPERVAVRAQRAPLGSSARAERLTASGSESSRGSKGQSDRVVALGVASLTPGAAHSRS